jgi:ketosteroid isomerase-like protein
MTDADLPRDDLPARNVSLIKSAYERYASGDLQAVLDLVDEDVEWTYLDPAEVDPEPQVCLGRHELEHAMKRQRAQGLRPELVEVLGHDDKVMVVTRTPGLDALRARHAIDRNFDVFTIRGGRVVALRACRDRTEALTQAGIT